MTAYTPQIGIKTIPNPDLEVIEGNKTRITHADSRRSGFHHLHRLARYGISLRAAHVMPLQKRMDLRIGTLESVRRLTSGPWFSAMVVVRDHHVLFERYAPDFGPHGIHSIQSISKTSMNLVVGRLVEQGYLDLSQRIGHYIPTIGSGYAQATLQEVLNMDVSNDYSEDFSDLRATYYLHEEAMGWRLPRNPDHEETQRGFVARIGSSDTQNRTGQIQYKDANTDVLGWVVECVTDRPLRNYLADLVDAAGIENVCYITTDRDGVPSIDGGVSMTARDLARYLQLFVRKGRGVRGEQVGSGWFIEQTLRSGIVVPQPFDGFRYSNHALVLDRSIAHGGWGGQFAIANLETGTVGVFFSVIENEHASNKDYLGPVVEMMKAVVS